MVPEWAFGLYGVSAYVEHKEESSGKGGYSGGNYYNLELHRETYINTDIRVVACTHCDGRGGPGRCYRG